MCGIMGYIGSRDVKGVLLEGLRRLEYRGYDSAGVAIVGEDGINRRRAVGRVNGLSSTIDTEMPGSAGIAHTRWATHGEVTKANAHPHMDAREQVAVVHNGIIENMAFLKNRLESEGVVFQSETDSEIIAHLVMRFYDGLGALGDSTLPDVQGDPVEAVRQALARLRGTWGISVVFADHPDVIIAARNGSPLVVGLGEDETFIASDPHALVPFTRQAVYLEDGDIVRIDRGGVQTFHARGEGTAPNVEMLNEDWGMGERGDFPHFMLKEIYDQPEALRQCLRGRVVKQTGTAKLGGLELLPRDMVDISQVKLLGCGTAFYACQVGATVIEHLARVPANAEIASEFRYRNAVIEPNALHFAVSQSGETADTLGAVKEIQLKGGKTMGVVNVVGSSIARACGRGVYIHSGPEMAVASTKAFSNMVAALSLFALQLGRTRYLSPHQGQEYADRLLEIPGLVERYLENPGPIDEVVRWVTRAPMVLFLGRGVSAPVAAEGALKLMEVAYIPCLAYPSGEMKHGPIALLERGSPVIVIAPNADVRDKTISNLEECRARGARVALIHTEGAPIGELADISIPVPATEELFSPLVTVLPLQLLAYKTGLALERDIDRPRNLAKSVTVE